MGILLSILKAISLNYFKLLDGLYMNYAHIVGLGKLFWNSVFDLSQGHVTKTPSTLQAVFIERLIPVISDKLL